MRLFNPQKDYSKHAAQYLVVLGVLNLLGLNLGGLFYMWLGSGIRNHAAGRRKGTLRLFAVGIGLSVVLTTGPARKGSRPLTS